MHARDKFNAILGYLGALFAIPFAFLGLIGMFFLGLFVILAMPLLLLLVFAYMVLEAIHPKNGRRRL